MIEKTLKTNKGKVRVRIPTQIAELTLGQLMAMQEKPELNDIEAISILSGVPVAELSNIKSMDDLSQFADYVQSLAHQIRFLYDSDAIPATVTFRTGGKPTVVKVVRNLSVEPVGAFMAAREIIAEEINSHINIYGEDNWQEYFKPSLKACCQVLAHFFYCRVTGNSYNEYEAEAFTTQVKQLGVTEALPIAKHFFINYPALSKPRTNCLLRLLRSSKKRLGSGLSKNSNTSTP